MMNMKEHVGMHPPPLGPGGPKYSPLHRHHDRGLEMTRRHCMNGPGNIFGPLDDSGFLARAEALAAVDVMSTMVKTSQPHMTIKNDTNYSHHHPVNSGMHPAHFAPTSSPVSRGLPHHHTMDHGEFLDISAAASLPGGGPGPGLSDVQSAAAAAAAAAAVSSHQSSFTPLPGTGGHFNPVNTMMPHGMGMHDIDTDPRELEAFAERFKQRRIKLGVTQADVGKALANLKLPGVGSLSQSTICRFESLTLSHNNMIALKPILAAWLDEAEAAARENRNSPGILDNGDKKRKRTSIAAPEKRSLEAYFTVQPRPSSEKIAAIAEKLDLKKNVVRVWFCNQRQKQKRMKYSAQPR
ncbi:brain-specific homeobox/POU domain protein 3-like [Lytechinus pictus]|uniref:brain-specific homeobox/POU domain protein 3-like n=1 Tax=Lytechinus variegatus TaxID=7654 RepID=UPI001BB19334|nr:brain-specific homeobox/POU domain protein 3-like [Lytechinus variegatus]XP_054754747.1 brain-specific homeobox/POU domain protein 3-like [Lytechinus pictus]